VSTAAGALRYLVVRSTVNRLHVQLRRLKTPRYVLALLAGGLWLMGVFSRSMVSPHAAGTGSDDFAGFFPMIYEAVLVLSALLTWIFGKAEPAIAFTGADVQMLFPAPVSRSALVRYKLVQAQFPILFTVVIWLAFLTQSSPLAAGYRAAALWVLFTTLYLHRVGASFVKVGAARHGAAGLRRHAIPAVLAAAAIAATGWGIWSAWPAMSAAFADQAFGTALLALRDTPALRVVLWPFHALVAPVFADAPAAWARAMIWAVLLFAGCYAWVMRAAVGFEEAAMQRAERLAAQRASRRSSRGGATLRAGRAWFTLALGGRPWVAIIWKNVTAFQRIANPGRTALLVAAGVVIISVSAPKNAALPMLFSTFSVMGILWLALLGAMAVRVDLQQDMLQLPLLRTYPLSGRTLVAAEIGGTILLLCAMEAILVVVALGTAALGAGMPRAWPARFTADALPIMLAGFIILPAFTALRVAVANAWAVLLPGWVRLGPDRQAGIEAMGQNLVLLAGSLIALLVLLILPGLAGTVVWFVLARSLHLAAWGAPPAAIVAAAVCAGELWLLVRWLGGVLSRTDPAAVEAATA
jgi:ABC-2 type transport system permease protein